MNINTFKEHFLKFAHEFNEYAEGCKEFIYTHEEEREKDNSIEKECKGLREALFTLSENENQYRMHLQEIVSGIKEVSDLGKVLFLTRCLEKRWLPDFSVELSSVIDYLIKLELSAPEFIENGGTFYVGYIEAIVDVILFEDKEPSPVYIPALQKVAKIGDMYLCWYAIKTITLLARIETSEAVEAIKDFLHSPNPEVAADAEKTLKYIAEG
jgi:HEAT repeat protein